MAAKNELLLSVNLPSGRVVHLVMADSPALWADDRFRLYQYGAVFIVVPQVGRFAGPIKLADYVTTVSVGLLFPSWKQSRRSA